MGIIIFRRKRKFIFIMFIVILLILLIDTSDSSNKAESLYSGSVQLNNVSRYSEKAIDPAGTDTLEIMCDNSQVSVYRWRNNIIKYESTGIIISGLDKETLKRKADDFVTDITVENKKIVLKDVFRGKTGEYNDCYTKLNIFIPQNIRNIRADIKSGSIAFLDDLNGNLHVSGGELDVTIKKIKGIFRCNIIEGDIVINTGYINGYMDIASKTGNISINSDFKPEGIYKINSGHGIIDLKVPEELNVQDVFNLTSSTGMIRITRY